MPKALWIPSEAFTVKGPRTCAEEDGERLSGEKPSGERGGSEKSQR